MINFRLGKLEMHIKISKLSRKEMGLEFKMPKMGRGRRTGTRNNHQSKKKETQKNHYIYYTSIKLNLKKKNC